MGTRFEIVLVRDHGADDAGERQLRAAGEAAIEEIEDWHRRLTRFEPDSFVSHLKRTLGRESVQLDAELFALFADALAVCHDSDGAFDVTMGSGELVLDSEARTIAFNGLAPALDLGAIGKGHALDCAAALLRRAGVRRAFLHGGTSSGLALGRAPDDDSWRVALGSAHGTVLTLADGQAFSMSDTRSQVDDAGTGHIADARRHTGASPERLPPRRVAVMGPSARLADAWSTALAIMGETPTTFPAVYRAVWM